MPLELMASLTELEIYDNASACKLMESPALPRNVCFQHPSESALQDAVRTCTCMQLT